MTDSSSPDDATLSVAALQKINQVCVVFEAALKRGERPRIESYLGDSKGHERTTLLRELLLLDLDYQHSKGETLAFEQYKARFPGDDHLVDGVFEQIEAGAGVGVAAACPPAKIRYFGDYEILEEVARGGMGVVYKALQVSLNRIVAVKMILAGQLAGDEEVKRFLTEAEAAANLQHPNIVAIHEVGEHEGQHYFSMDYVEGKSLAEMARAHPLPAKSAAEYVKTIAEAIHYAHEKGTVHRDLKPSNILIDSSGAVRITDFGLAKRIEGGSELTGTGQILGTPSFMPPEQASGGSSEIGASADNYALGAILYNLLTGRPPFQAASVIDTLRQVLENEPVPPRQLDSTIDRDLETICLKCLSKQPRDRYESARELSEDLERYLQHEPIRARSIGRIERVRRWVWKRRRNVASAAAAAVVMALLIFGGMYVIGYYREHYREFTSGTLSVKTSGPPMQADFLLGHDKKNVHKSVTVPTTEAVSIPAGFVRLRLSAPARLTKTYGLEVKRGENPSLHVVLGEEELWRAIDVRNGFDIAEFGGLPDLIVISKEGFGRVRGTTGEEIWRVKVNPAEDTVLAGVQGFSWDWPDKPPSANWGRETPRPQLLDPAFDLDGDGTRDLVWALQHQATLLAVSGKNGGTLWCRRSLPKLPEGLSEEPLAALSEKHSHDRVLGSSVFVDVNQDGTSDVVAAFICVIGEFHEIWAEAVSGIDGRPLWRTRLAYDGILPPRAAAALIDDNTVVALAVGSWVYGLAVRSGRELWKTRHGGRGDGFVEFVDLQGPGNRLLLQYRISAWDRYSEPYVVQWKLQVVSPGTAEPLLSFDHYTIKSSPSLGAHSFHPLVADISGDGLAEVILVGTELAVFEGISDSLLTTRLLWRQSLRGSGEKAIVGPDLDGDGTRDLFSAIQSLDPTHSLVVEARSGKTGAKIWRWNSDPRKRRETPTLGALHWWGPESDPLLVVSLEREVTYLLSASNGEVAFTIDGVTQVEAADLDGDGLADLLYQDGTGKLHALRGYPRESWRAFGRHRALADLDSDGVTDLLRLPRAEARDFSYLSQHETRVRCRSDGDRMVAVSGKNGRILWEAPLGRGYLDIITLLPPGGDLDDDGAEDILCYQPDENLRAFSGKTGRELWIADRRVWNSPDFTTQRFYAGFVLESCDVDGDGRSEVIFAIVTSESRFCVALLCGQDGRRIWMQHQPINLHTIKYRRTRLRLVAMVKANGDDVLDLILGVGKRVLAMDGRDGTPLWNQGLSTPARSLRVADLDGDGANDVLVCHGGEEYGQDGVSVLDGRDGDVKWTWLRESEETKPKRQRTWRGPIPLVIRIEGLQESAVAVWAPGSSEIVLLTSDGQVYQSRDVACLPGSRILAADLSGGGQDELVFPVEGGLVATRHGVLDVLWYWRPPGGQCKLLHVVSEGSRPKIVVQTGAGIYAIDGTTGEPSWRCDGPFHDFHSPYGPTFLWGGEESAYPHVLFHKVLGKDRLGQPTSIATVCRVPIPVGRIGRSVAR